MQLNWFALPDISNKDIQDSNSSIPYYQIIKKKKKLRKGWNLQRKQKKNNPYHKNFPIWEKKKKTELALFFSS